MNELIYNKILDSFVKDKLIIVQKEYVEEVFGSWFIEISLPSRIRVVWDGKENQLSIQKMNGLTWEDIWYADNILEEADKLILELKNQINKFSIKE